MAYKPFQRALSLTPKELFIQSIHKVRDNTFLAKTDQEYINAVTQLETAVFSLYFENVPADRKHATNYKAFLEALDKDTTLNTRTYATKVARELEAIMFEAGMFGGNEQTAVVELEAEEKEDEPKNEA